MDSAGKNRYELLFMDDDISDPLDNIVAKKKKQVKTAAATRGGAATATAAGSTAGTNNGPKTTNKPPGNTNQVKKSNQAEKENKPLNKNETKKPFGAPGTTAAAGGANDRFQKQGGAGANAGGANRNRNNGEATREGGQGQQQQRNVNFRQQNGETREQRNNRRNVRENGQTGGAGVAAVGVNVGGEGGPQNRPPFRGGDRADRNERPPRNRNFEGGNRKREFDRQSGSDKTGIKSIDKRDGAGAHNWGSVKDTIEEGNTIKTVEENGNAAAPNVVERNDESGNEQITEQTPVEEEVKELTLDEWKAQQQQRAKPQFNIRKAGEGEDATKWKKMVVLTNTKAAKEANKKGTESEDELEFDPAMYPQRVGRQQRVLDIQFNFNDGRRLGGFGGRGRGGGNRNGPRNNNNNGAAAAEGGAPAPAKPRFEGGNRGGYNNAAGSRGGASASGGGSRRQFGDKQNAAPRVNDERQFPTLA